MAPSEGGGPVAPPPPPAVAAATAATAAAPTPTVPEASDSVLERVGQVMRSIVPTPDLTQIGNYRLHEIIGEGGMGVVFRAEQLAPIRRTVALKLIRPGMVGREVLARFRDERQALALMNHPNVARVLDAGATEHERPYFVMEHVPGRPINAFCDERRLTLSQRLELFAQACAGVQHAHQKAIIHRDLKPSNILVTLVDEQPVVKVIDFGVAKALGDGLPERTLCTESGQLIGTPEYMSPEQAEGDESRGVDTRSDVYSLGVVLYELLTGMLPFDAHELRSCGLAGIGRTLREVDPPRPGGRLSSLAAAEAAAIADRRQTRAAELSRQLKDELEWIPLRAMRKDPAERYATAAQFAQDINNYLCGRPLLAGPESARYRMRKFARRNKGALLGAGAFALLLAGGAALYVYGLRAEQRKTLTALAEAKQVADFQAQMLSGIDVQLMGKRLRDAVIEEAEQSWVREKLDADQVTHRRTELESLLHGSNFTNPAIKTLDQNIIERALRTIDEKFGDQPVVKAKLLQNLTNVLRSFSLLERATPPQLEALRLRQRDLGDDHPETLDSIHSMALLLAAKARWADAEPYALDLLKRRQRLLGPWDQSTIKAKALLAEVLQRQHRLAEAEPYRREVVEESRRMFGENDAFTLESLVMLGQCLLWEERLSESEKYLEQALRGAVQRFREDGQLTLRTKSVLAGLRMSQERLPEAERLLKEALQGIRGAVGDDQRQTLFLTVRIGTVLREQGKLDEAEPFLRAAADDFRRALGPDHVDTLVADEEMARLRQAQGRADEAEARYAELAAKAARADLPPSYAASFIGHYGLLLAGRSRYADANAPLLDAYERFRRMGQQRERQHQRTMQNVLAALAEVCDHANRPDEAAKWRDELARLRAATQPATTTR